MALCHACARVSRACVQCVTRVGRSNLVRRESSVLRRRDLLNLERHNKDIHKHTNKHDIVFDGYIKTIQSTVTVTHYFQGMFYHQKC